MGKVVISFSGTMTIGAGSDFAAYVDPLPGGFIFTTSNKDPQCSLTLFNHDILSIVVLDNLVSGSVQDQYNALNH